VAPILTCALDPTVSSDQIGARDTRIPGIHGQGIFGMLPRIVYRQCLTATFVLIGKTAEFVLGLVISIIPTNQSEYCAVRL
jgi:hypothetical protein